VMLVHHAGKTGDGESGRGINTIEGAATSEFAVTKSGMAVTVKTTKQKDIEKPGPVKLTLKPVGSSVVFSNDMVFVEPAARDRTQERARALYLIMRDRFSADGGTRAEIQDHLKADGSMVGLNWAKGGTGSVAILSAWRELIKRGLLLKMDRAARFKVVELPAAGPDGVLTPNVGEHQQEDPAGWATWCPEAIGAAPGEVKLPPYK
jgi:hypothetical protein